MAHTRSRRLFARTALLLPMFLLSAAAATAQWSETFDSYATGSELLGQGGWDGCLSYGGPASSAQAHSAPNSAMVPGADATDLYSVLSGYTSGHWVLRGWVYVPSSSTGEAWFTLNSTYTRTGCGITAVPAQGLGFYGDTGMVMYEGEGEKTVPMVRNRWVEMVFDFDLDADHCTVHYDGIVMYDGSWTRGYPGWIQLRLQAVNLYADSGALLAYYDDFTLEAWKAPAVPALGTIGLAALAALVLAGGALAILRRAA